MSTHPDRTGRGNAWDELQTEAKAVAAQQRTAELTEWLGCAKIALQVWLCFLRMSSPVLSVRNDIGGLCVLCLQPRVHGGKDACAVTDSKQIQVVEQ